MLDVPDVDPAADADVRTRDTSSLGPRRGVVVALVTVAVVAVVAVVAGDVLSPSPRGTLGHLGVPTGLVADGPLPSGELELAWEHDPVRGGGFDPSAFVTAEDPTVLGDALVGIGGIVVDTSTGETIGGLPTTPGLVAVGDGEAAILMDGERVTYDVRTGAVVDRVMLRDARSTLRFAYASLPDGTLLAQAAGRGASELSVLVAPDGTVRPAIPPAVVEGITGGSADAGYAWQTTRVGPVFVLEVFPTVGPVLEAPAAHLVDVATGELLGQLPEPSGFVAPLVATEQAVVTVGGEVLWSMGLDGRVSQLDLRTGEEFATLSLLGVIDDQLVVARPGGGGDWELLAVPGPPWATASVPVTSIGTVDPRPRGQRSSPAMPSPPGIVEVSDATVTDDLVVAVDDDGAAIVARDLTGAERWRRPVTDDAMVSSVDDLVLLTEPSPAGTTSTLLDAQGAEVWSDVTGASRFSVGARVVDGDVVYTDASFPLDAVSGELVTDRGPRAPQPGETAIAVIDDPDGVGSGVLASRRVGGADGSEVVTIGDDVVIELASGNDGNDLLVGIAESVLLLREFRATPEDDVAGFTSFTSTSVLVQPDGDRIEVEGAFANGLFADPGLASIAVVRRDDGTALLDPGTGRPRFVVAELVAMVEAGDGRLVAQRAAGWRVLDATDGATVGEPRDELARLVTVGDGLVATAGVDGSLAVVRTSDGATAWQRDAATIAPTAMVLTGSHLLVGTRDGRVVEHDATGQVVRATQVGDGPVTSIAAATGTLVVGVDDVLRGFRTDGDGLTSRDEVRVP